MANNILITQGSGTTMATHDVGGVHFQRIKKAYGNDSKIASDLIPFKFNTNSTANPQIIAAVSGKVIVIASLVISVSAAVNVKLQSFDGSSTYTDLHDLLYLDVKGGYVLPFSEVGWLKGVNGQRITVSLSTGVAVTGFGMCWTE